MNDDNALSYHEYRAASQRRIDQLSAPQNWFGQMKALASASVPTRQQLSPMAWRDLTVAAASGGGYLAPTGNSPMEQFLLPQMMLRDGGLKMLSGLSAAVTVPRCTTVPTATWLSTEGSTPTTSDPVFGQVGVTPKMLSIYLRVSRQLMLQSNAESVVAPLCAESIARGIEAALFNGGGTSGRPLGVMNTAGINSQSGASLAAAGLRAMRRNVLSSGAREDRLMWVGAPDVQELLGSREFSAGSGRPLWDDGKILGRPAVASTLIPAATLICGDWSRATVALFDAAGAELEVNPYDSFQSGAVGYRLMIPCDVFFSPAAAFAVATTIT